MAAQGWNKDAQGRWFAIDRFGKRIFSPTTANRPSDSVWKSSDWNPATGEWEKKTNWGNIIGLATGAAALAPAAIAAGGALAGGAGGGAASSGIAPGVIASSAPSIGGVVAPAALSTGAVVPGSVAAGTHLGLTGAELWRAGAGGADTILGLLQSRSQGKAADRASQLQASGIAAQLAFERENEARRREEYDRAEAQAKAQWDADQARRAPYRAAAAAILSRYSGQPASSYGAPTPYPGAGAPVSRPLTSPTTAAQTIGEMATAAVPPPMVAPLRAPQVAYNPQARTINDLLRY